MPTAPAELGRRANAWFAPHVAGGVAVVVTAALLFTHFGLHNELDSNEAIYAYGGQQLLNGVPPYASIFDPKGPLATLLSGLGTALGRLFGYSDLTGIRALFGLVSVLAVLAIYLLALELWKSIPGAVVAAVVFASFWRFAVDALGGPDAKTAGMLPIILCMYFAVRRQWFRSAMFGSIAVVAWQPLASFVVVTLLLALTLGDPAATSPPNGRDATENTEGIPTPAARAPHWRAFGRAVAGGVIPIAVVAVYFAVAGAWSYLIESAVQFPLIGRQVPHRSFGQQISWIVTAVDSGYRFSAVLFWAGTISVIGFVVVAFVRNRHAPLVALKDPVVSVIALGWVLQAGFMLYDFEGGPDLFPVLPAAAVCLGGVFAVATNACRGNARQLATAVTLVAALALAVGSWLGFVDRGQNLNDQLANACGLQRTVSGTGRLWVMGNPVPLVLTGRTNPDRFIYLSQGNAEWKVRQTDGGFDGWMAQVAAVHPSVVVTNQFSGDLGHNARRWLSEHGYRHYFIGTWKVFVLPGVRANALAHGVQITRQPTNVAIDENGTRLSTHCGMRRIG